MQRAGQGAAVRLARRDLRRAGARRPQRAARRADQQRRPVPADGVDERGDRDAQARHHQPGALAAGRAVRRRRPPPAA